MRARASLSTFPSLSSVSLTNHSPSSHSLTHSLALSFIRALVRVFVRAFVHSSNHLFSHSFTYPSTHSFYHACTHPVILSPFHSPIRSFFLSCIHSSSHSLTVSFTHPLIFSSFFLSPLLSFLHSFIHSPNANSDHFPAACENKIGTPTRYYDLASPALASLDASMGGQTMPSEMTDTSWQGRDYQLRLERSPMVAPTLGRVRLEVNT
jgi:hypothetical protein